MKSKWIWILISGLAWPLLHYLDRVTRYSADIASIGLMKTIIDFGLLGLVAGWIFFFFRERAKNVKQARMAAFGYLAATPFAFIGSVIGDSFLPGLLGAIAFGSLALLIGAGLGYFLGGMGSAG